MRVSSINFNSIKSVHQYNFACLSLIFSRLSAQVIIRSVEEMEMNAEAGRPDVGGRGWKICSAELFIRLSDWRGVVFMKLHPTESHQQQQTNAFCVVVLVHFQIISVK
ncbi:hypothetical protein HELRODRAFT_167876 [Helobdella robusta]|uniref:Uncharacterized protein n=1 Tax=Helobdella robusta TaxID=6412 RepID=T1EZW9_HELRO|nr:hypothetical protein HELRODRAFT_167876 [Helobdella robusta]ESO10036.1 hypothetical protein HELRODRAFT_167876 [Helobdella robusta]